MNTPTPKVSIGMPVFNGEQFLREVLDSLLSQTYSDFELVISDNGSTDKTPEICAQYAASDARIRYDRSEENLGAARNYNRVFEMAQGEYFKWAAADDLCDPEYLDRCVDVLDHEGDVVLCYPKTRIIDENSHLLRNYEDGLNMVSSSAGARFIQTYYNCRLCNAVFGLIRSRTLSQTRLIKDFIASDKVLLAELSLFGLFREVPEYLFARRFHAVPSGTLKADVGEYEASFVSLGQEKQLEWLNPTRKNNATFVNWTLFGAYMISIKRSPVKLSQKLFTMFFLLISLFANRQYLLELRYAMHRFMQLFAQNVFSWRSKR